MNTLFRNVMTSFARPMMKSNSFLAPSLKSIQPMKFNFQQIREKSSSLKHKKVLSQTKGFRGRANRCFTVAFHRLLKARQFAYRDRKVKKRDMRSLWIQRINAGTRLYGTTYSALINGMTKTNIQIDRKILSELAITEPLSFKSVVAVVKETAVKK